MLVEGKVAWYTCRKFVEWLVVKPPALILLFNLAYEEQAPPEYARCARHLFRKYIFTTMHIYTYCVVYVYAYAWSFCALEILQLHIIRTQTMIKWHYMILSKTPHFIVACILTWYMYINMMQKCFLASQRYMGRRVIWSHISCYFNTCRHFCTYWKSRSVFVHIYIEVELPWQLISMYHRHSKLWST